MVHNEFKIGSVFCTFNLVVTNTPRAAKVSGSNLTRTSFFQTLNVPVQKKFGLFACFVGLIALSNNHFF